ncbi:MAG: helix-turn-helix transcriptional regulator [Fimbriimonadaceae bacterium]|nr:helix-turn-helix transcriptional regulator [Fimbriimonadaceae bacterium]
MNRVFEALSHPDRRSILARLRREGELTAGELAAEFACSKPTLSHHLGVLTQAGLLDREKRGQFVFYRVNATVFQEMLTLLWDLFAVEREMHHARNESAGAAVGGTATAGGGGALAAAAGSDADPLGA